MKISENDAALGGFPDIVDSDGMDGIQQWLSHLNTHLFKQFGAALGGRALEVETSQSQPGSQIDIADIMVLTQLDMAAQTFIKEVNTSMTAGWPMLIISEPVVEMATCTLQTMQLSAQTPCIAPC